MSNSRKSAVLGLLFLLVSLLACSLPMEWVLERPTPEVRSSPTQGLSPTPLPTRPTSPTATWTTSPTNTALPPITPTPGPTRAATLPPLSTPTPFSHIAAPTVLSQADYQVVERIQLTNAGPGTVERLTLRVALIRSLVPYQDVLRYEVQPSPVETTQDEYGNEYGLIEFRNLGAGESVAATLTYQLRVYGLLHDLSLCSGEVPQTNLDPETYVESDSEDIEALASELSIGPRNDCEILKALYDYVGDNISYSSYEAGDRGAAWALNHGSGDCTEFADALLALSRAAGIPARFLEGVTYREGERQDSNQIKHDWLEAYLPGHGWVPLDPTWGRFPNRRDAYFARMSQDHIIVTVGRNLSTLRGYHYFYYNWSGADVNLSHQGTWSVSKTP